MTKLELTCSDEKATFLLRAARLYDEGVELEPVRHGSWKHIKKHLWYKDDNGDVDMWYVDHGYHNGPGCKICGERFCEHCDPNWADDECEIGYYVCSECEQSTETGDSPYCPNCGAKMDGGKL